ncbi:UTP--glucose-1-phosphate uridylyltransferase [Oceanospirillum multiglobuliferum]|uniref:UTP--glucose-1-phosphate uridylyltransferase n=1 Tax=Oceanospirillum multiglobuliferum TaxID=64969 RepID=UPI0009997BEE|nr:UTP--glucose-1-phosphate uridylyltransferase [Oceanospirillum multiglobuliferum]SKA24671.1 UTP--glucose-1-phosphate uridylyltransferase [Oceanospirillum multiglobuliferum]
MLKKAIIPVAGIGTRLLPISKAIPKEMVPVVDRPLIQHVVEEALAAGLNEVILVTRGGKSAIEDHFDHHYELMAELERKNKQQLLDMLSRISPPELKITSVRQEQALGLGHAIYCAAHLLQPHEPFAVILPDVLVKNNLGSLQEGNDLASMVQRYQQTSYAQVMVEPVPLARVDQYGIVDCAGLSPAVGQSTIMQAIIEKPIPEKAPSQLSVVGRYILPGEIMALLAETPPGAGGEIQLTDAIAALIKQGQGVEAYRIKGRTFDCGYIQGWLQANTVLGREAGLIGRFD